MDEPVTSNVEKVKNMAFWGSLVSTPLMTLCSFGGTV